jgi:succinate-acetate transporter protein
MLLATELFHGGIAQLGEHSVRNAGVEGSNPFASTIFPNLFVFHLNFQTLMFLGYPRVLGKNGSVDAHPFGWMVALFSIFPLTLRSNPLMPFLLDFSARK